MGEDSYDYFEALIQKARIFEFRNADMENSAAEKAIDKMKKYNLKVSVYAQAELYYHTCRKLF